MDNNEITLSEMLAELRKELLNAQREGTGSDLKFQVEDIEVELQLATTKGGKGGGGVKLCVFNATAEANASKTATQKLKLKLKLAPGPDDKSRLIGGVVPYPSD